MELQRRAVQSATRSNDGRNNNDHVDGDKDIPNYLRPSTGSCHHACKYGSAHAFQERDGTHSRSRATARPKPARKQQPAGQSDHQKTRARSLVPRKLFGGGEQKVDKAAADAAVKEEEKKKKKKKQPPVNDDDVEWKDIVAYDQTTVVPVAPHGSGPPELLVGDDKQSEQQRTSRGKKKLLPNKHKAKINNPAAKQVVGGGKSRKESADKKLVTSVGSKTMMSSKQVSSTEPSRHRSVNTADIINSSVKKPPRGNTKLPTVLTANEKKAVAADREQLLVVDGYHHQPLSPSLLRTRASLSRDLEHQEMLQVHHGEAAANNNANAEFLKTTHSCLDHHQQQEEEFAAAETEISSSRPIIPAHRRVKSMTMNSRSSVRFPILARQASKNSAAAAAFKLRSKSSRSGPTTTAPSEEENKKPAARLVRSRRGSVGGGADNVASTGGRGIQLRIRSLRRRGSSSGSGFVVPAVSLRHQKTLEKRRSQRLYNTVIEETASKLVKTRKSRVKALVGAFESVISKIAK